MKIQLKAALRLEAAKVLSSVVEGRPVMPPKDEQSQKIGQMKAKCGCDDKTAKHYLSDEDWDVNKAIESYKSDRTKGLHATLKASARLQIMARSDNGDKERLLDLKKQIGYLKQDIEEIEADGDDARRERKLLKDLEAEQALLNRRKK